MTIPVPRELRMSKDPPDFRPNGPGMIISGAGSWGDLKNNSLPSSDSRKVPVVVVFNKSDLAEPEGSILDRLDHEKIPVVRTAAPSGKGILDLRQTLSRCGAVRVHHHPAILGDLVGAGEMAVLVTPIDKEAPKAG